MSVSSEITRLQGLRNDLRTKLISLGVTVPSETWVLNDATNGSGMLGPYSYTHSVSWMSGSLSGNSVSTRAKGIEFNVEAGGPAECEWYSSSGTKKYSVFNTVTFETAPTGDLLTWLQANAVKQSGGQVSSDADLDECVTAVEGIANRGAISKTLDATSGNQTYAVPGGYHNGSGSVGIVLEEKTVTTNGDVVPTAGKVLSKVTVNVDTAPTLQTKTVTPTTSTQTVEPDSGYDGLSEVTVNPIPSNYADVSDVTATAGDVLSNKVFVTAAGVETAGTMVDNGTVTATIDGLSTPSYTIPAGKHSGSGTVSLTNDIETALAAI